MLCAELDNLVENRPKVQNEGVSKKETGNEPVKPMHKVVVINICPKAIPGEFTIIIVGMHASLNLGI